MLHGITARGTYNKNFFCQIYYLQKIIVKIALKDI